MLCLKLFHCIGKCDRLVMIKKGPQCHLVKVKGEPCKYGSSPVRVVGFRCGRKIG